MMDKLYCILCVVALFFSTGCRNENGSGYLEASGTLEARYVTLSAKTAGQITRYDFDEGSKVSIGDTIAVIDPAGTEIQIRAAIAAKDAADAQLALLLNGARDEDIAQAEAGLSQAKLSSAQAESDKNRFEQLVQSASVTRKQYDDAVTRAAVAKEQLRAAEENVKKVKRLFREEEIRAARARSAQAEAAVAAAKKQYADAHLIAPAAGVLVNKFYEQGESVSPLSAVAKISDLSILYLWVYLLEAEVAKVKLGSAAEISIDAFPGQNFEAKVVFINPESEFTPKNIQTKDERTKLVFGVKLEIANPDLTLKSGLPADARIKVSGS